MTVDEALQALLKSYKRYYNITTVDVAEPFAAEAVFHTHDEQFFLTKSATLSEADAHEYVFFATADNIGAAQVQKLDHKAWDEGLSRVVPHSNHRSTDIVLIILAEHITQDAAGYIKKAKRYKSYRFTLQGWSHYSLVALETSTGNFFCNRRGKSLKKLFRNIMRQADTRSASKEPL